MAHIVYIGDESTAAGFRLAGVRTLLPEPSEVTETVQRAESDGAELILVSARLAAHLPVTALESLLARETPLVAIAPEVPGQGLPPDLAHEVRAALGIES